jgi:hypothetical protein
MILPRDIIKEIISYYPCPQWYRLCKELYTLASQVISPGHYSFKLETLWVGPLEYFAYKGNVEVVAFLLKDPRVNPASVNPLAVLGGHKDMVEMLLKDPRVNPAADGDYSIRLASRSGHKDIGKMLLKDPRVNPTTSGDNALWWAVNSGHKEVAELLLKDPRVNSASIAQ